jgi:hypothetical protein
VGVTFMNTEGMSFIGPGSEWFWTAISGLVLAVTFLAIYRQLSIARSTEAREQLASLEREWSSERQMRYRLEIFVALRDGAKPAHVPDGPATALLNWWEGVASLARSGSFSRKSLHATYRLICQRWWILLADYVRRIRDEEGDSAIFEDFEWLVGLMAETDRQSGKASVDKAMAGPIDDEITYLEGRIRVEEALRTVIFKSPEIGSIAPVRAGDGHVAANA